MSQAVARLERLEVAPARAAASMRVRPWYGLIAIPPREIAERLRCLQEQLAAPGAEPQPHITLKMPFQVRTRLAEVKGRIAEVARRTSPIGVSVRGVGGFPGPYSNAVYASVQRNPGLHALHTALVRALDGSVENAYPYAGQIELARYVPHITIASDLSEEDFARLLGRLQNQPIEGCFEITRLHLMRRDAQGRWRVAQAFSLSQEGPTQRGWARRGEAVASQGAGCPPG